MVDVRHDRRADLVRHFERDFERHDARGSGGMAPDPHLDADDDIAVGVGDLDRNQPRRRSGRAISWTIWRWVGARVPFPQGCRGGEAQRVAIARALANRPRIILADEPTAALDSKRAQIVMDLLRRLALDRNAAVIAVTHDEKIFDRFDRMFMLRDGRLEDVVRMPEAA
jgi:putative ABC transport system ATP-binding protein